MNTEKQSNVQAMLTNADNKVSYTAGSLTVGTYGEPALGQTTNLCYRDWFTVYPNYYTTIVKVESSKFEQAFKIVSNLMENGHIKELTVKEFTKLVEEVAEELK